MQNAAANKRIQATVIFNCILTSTSLDLLTDWLTNCLPPCLSRYLPACLCVCLFVSLSVSMLSIWLSVCLSIHLPIYQSACLSVCVSVCVSLSRRVQLSVWLMGWMWYTEWLPDWYSCPVTAHLSVCLHFRVCQTQLLYLSLLPNTSFREHLSFCALITFPIPITSLLFLALRHFPTSCSFLAQHNFPTVEEGSSESQGIQSRSIGHKRCTWKMAERGSCKSGRQSCRELELIPDSVFAVKVGVRRSWNCSGGDLIVLDIELNFFNW